MRSPKLIGFSSVWIERQSRLDLVLTVCGKKRQDFQPKGHKVLNWPIFMVEVESPKVEP